MNQTSGPTAEVHETPSTAPAAGQSKQPVKKLIVAVHGIGKQFRYATIKSVAEQFGIHQAGYRLDLAVENRAQLIAVGVSSERIEHIGDCTFCNPAQFFSWRRDHDRAGRMISFIRTAGKI